MEGQRLTRRRFLALTAAGAGGILLQQGLSRLGNTAQDHSAHGVTLLEAGSKGAIAQASPAVGRFQAALPIPSVLQPTSSDATTDYYTLHAAVTRHEILPGFQTSLYTYGEAFPAKTIEARRGRTTKLRVYNDLPSQMISCHNHGGVTAAQHDGYAEDITINGVKLPTLIRTGASWEYEYPNQQSACTNWFHDHGIHHTAEHVYRGLAGFYLIRDDEEASFNLPQGPYEIPLVLQDRIFDSSGELRYAHNGHDGVEGDVQLVNGAPWPRLQVAARKYRFRLLNGSTWRRYHLQFSNKLPFRQIGTESGFLRAPVNQQMIRMYPAERVDVVVDFSKVAVGTTIYLTNQSKESKGTPMQQMMAFEVVRTESDDSQVPAALASYEDLTTPAAVGRSVITRKFVFDRTNGIYAINGKGWNVKRFDARPRLGTTEIWRFINNSGGWFHPIHVHLVNFQILDRKIDGKTSKPLPWERGRKDTVAIPENEEARVVIKWDAEEYQHFTGPYMMHCHNVDHEDHDMMTQFEVLPPA
jgi:spore coat protein A, manganese oxidase